MKFANSVIVAMVFCVGLVSAQDQCKPIGWATKNGRTSTAASVTGGGNATPIVVNNFADLATHAAGTDPKVIYIDGTVGAGWAGTSGDRLSIGSNKTIIGLRAKTELKAPIIIKNNSNVIVRNLVIKGPGSNTDQAWDNIVIEGTAKNIWIDHCEFWDGQDGNSDAVKGADNITYTWNIFGYTKGGVHNLSNLIASSDSEPASVGKLNITFMGNWFRGIAQRGPRCRYGNIHVVNNLYTTDGLQSDYAISAGFDCEVITENNHFIGTNTPIYTSHKAGTSAHAVSGNIFEGTSGNQTGYGSAFNVPYDRSFVLAATSVKAAVQSLAGATLASPTTCVAGGTSSIAVSSSAVTPPSSVALSSSSSAVVTPIITLAVPAINHCSANGVSETKNTGFESSAYLNLDNNIGSAALYTINANAQVQSQMVVRFANGGTINRNMDVLKNGTVVGELVFPISGAWTTWQIAQMAMTLNSGRNEISLRSKTAEGAPNIDWIGFTAAGLAVADCNPTGIEMPSKLLGIGMILKGSQLSISNPDSKDLFVEILSITGSRILQRNVSAQSQGLQIDLAKENVPNGVYLVRISSLGAQARVDLIRY